MRCTRPPISIPRTARRVGDMNRLLTGTGGPASCQISIPEPVSLYGGRRGKIVM